MAPEVSQGTVEFEDELTECQLVQLKERLSDLGFEVLDDASSHLLDSISNLVNQLMYEDRGLKTTDYPMYLKEQLKFNDSEITRLFTQVFGIDLLQYIAIRQVERIKELILYENKEPDEIAALLRFESIAQMTQLFKKITGLPPVYYKQIKEKRLEVRERNGF